MFTAVVIIDGVGWMRNSRSREPPNGVCISLFRYARHGSHEGVQPGQDARGEHSLQYLPKLIASAANSERRSVVQQLITEVYARQKAVIAFRPTRLAERP